MFPQGSPFLPKEIGLWGKSWRLVQKVLGSLTWRCAQTSRCQSLMGGHLENGWLILWRAAPTEASVHNTARLAGSKPNSGAPGHGQGPAGLLRCHLGG